MICVLVSTIFFQESPESPTDGKGGGISVCVSLFHSRKFCKPGFCQSQYDGPVARSMVEPEETRLLVVGRNATFHCQAPSDEAVQLASWNTALVTLTHYMYLRLRRCVSARRNDIIGIVQNRTELKHSGPKVLDRTLSV